MEQEQVQEEKPQQEKKKKHKYKSSPKKKLTCIMNPLKTGEHSKYYRNPRVVRLLKDPLLMGELLLETIDKIQNEDLMPKERIVFLNVLANIYKAIFKVDLGSVLKEMSNKETIADLIMVRIKNREILPDHVEDEIKEVLRRYRETKVDSVMSKMKAIEEKDKEFTKTY